MRRSLIAGLGWLLACEKAEPNSALPPTVVAASLPAVSTPPAPNPVPRLAPSVDSSPRRPAAPTIELTAGREIAIASGVVQAGSPTGQADRNPSSEADGIALEVPAFAIDALPYPNDPAQPFRAAVARAEAQELCKASGKRLCHELEWERACKGDANASYPHFRDGFSATECQRDPRLCATALGVLSLGATAREWTDSSVTMGLGDSLRTAVVRGATVDAPLRAHRCAARDAATPDSKSASLTFRCCRGDAPSLAYPTEQGRATFREAAVSATQLPALLGTLDGLAGRLTGFRPFTEREIGESLQRAGSSRARVAPWVASASVLSWSPVHGEDVLLVAGDTPAGAVLVVAYRLAGDRLSLIGTFETANEHGAIVLAYKADAPKEVLFSSCWGCGGEGGAVVFGEDARIQISPR